MRHIDPAPAFRRRRRYHIATTLVKWQIGEGGLFRKGDPLFSVVHHSRHRFLSRLFPSKSIVQTAHRSGILLSIRVRSGRIRRSDILADFVLFQEWEAFTALISSQEQAITRFKTSGRFHSDAERSAEELRQECVPLLDEIRVEREKEFPRLISALQSMTVHVREEDRTARKLDGMIRRAHSPIDSRYRSVLKGYSLDQLLDQLLDPLPAGTPPRVGSSPVPVPDPDPDLSDAAFRRILEVVRSSLPVPVSLEEFLLFLPHFERLSGSQAAFARFDADLLALHGDDSLSGPEKAARLKSIRLSFRKNVNTAFLSPTSPSHGDFPGDPSP